MLHNAAQKQPGNADATQVDATQGCQKQDFFINNLFDFFGEI